MLQVKDIPQDLLDKINEQFEADPKVRQLRVQQQMFMRTGKYKEALSLAQDLDVLRNKVVYEYLEESERQVEKVDVADMDMPLEDKERLMHQLLVCFMCADIIETSVMEMDDILHKYDKGLRMEMFNDIRELMKMSKSKLQYLQENSGYMKDLVWADKCDDMYEMIKNKAASVMRKRKNDPNYGKNKEKFQ